MDGLKEKIAAAYDIAKGYEEPFRTIIFEGVLNWTLSHHGDKLPRSRTGTEEASVGSSERSPDETGQEPKWQRMAEHADVPVERLQDIFEYSDGQVLVTGDAGGQTNTEERRRVGALLAWVYKHGLGCPNVPASVLRAELERLGILDKNNWTKNVVVKGYLKGRKAGKGKTATDYTLTPTGEQWVSTYLRADGLPETPEATDGS